MMRRKVVGLHNKHRYSADQCPRPAKQPLPGLNNTVRESPVDIFDDRLKLMISDLILPSYQYAKNRLNPFVALGTAPYLGCKFGLVVVYLGKIVCGESFLPLPPIVGR